MKKSKTLQKAQQEQNIPSQIDRDAIIQITSHNLRTLFDSQPGSKAAIARACCITPANVSRWTAKENATLPQAEYLLYIAKYFHVTVDWILTEHETSDAANKIEKYNDAFLALIPLLKYEIIHLDSIRSLPLKHLCDRYINITSGSIQKDKINEWLQHIIQEYDIPLHCAPDQEIYDYYINHFKTNIQDIDDDMTYRNIAQLLTEDEIESIEQVIEYDKSSVQVKKDKLKKDIAIFQEYLEHDNVPELDIPPFSAEELDKMVNEDQKNGGNEHR